MGVFDPDEDPAGDTGEDTGEDDDTVAEDVAPLDAELAPGADDAAVAPPVSDGSGVTELLLTAGTTVRRCGAWWLASIGRTRKYRTSVARKIALSTRVDVRGQPRRRHRSRIQPGVTTAPAPGRRCPGPARP